MGHWAAPGWDEAPEIVGALLSLSLLFPFFGLDELPAALELGKRRLARITGVPTK